MDLLQNARLGNDCPCTYGGVDIWVETEPRNSNPVGSLKKNYFFTLGAVEAILASTWALM